MTNDKKIYLLPILLLALVFVSCEETKEVSIYDNWQERNEAFIDSLRNEFMTNREVSGLDTIHLLSAPDDYIFYKEKTPVKNEPENPDNIYEYIEGYDWKIFNLIIRIVYIHIIKVLI
mgnify:CR=1 FL=1